MPISNQKGNFKLLSDKNTHVKIILVLKSREETPQQQKAPLKPDIRDKPYLNKVLSLEGTVWLMTQLHWHSPPGRLQGKTKVG